MSKLKMITDVVVLIGIAALIATSQYFMSKAERQQKQIAALQQQLQQTELQLTAFKQQQQQLLTLLEQQQQQATKQKQRINEVLQNENHKSWRDQLVPSDISRLLNTAKIND
ncbi:hypothetical protein JL12_09815 [Gallibacterium anatis 10672-6]|uniref:hypothetical protein n=1 Tax=Gallibacterium anatis TaxID=750 RepID=UPI0005318336|nr:hypothetical protein [Gallibacterium anatis]KGQ48168.1 hypothetical protein JL12_09815 [Gallibacterium anatis 10672-6]